MSRVLHLLKQLEEKATFSLVIPPPSPPIQESLKEKAYKTTN